MAQIAEVSLIQGKSSVSAIFYVFALHVGIGVAERFPKVCVEDPVQNLMEIIRRKHFGSAFGSLTKEGGIQKRLDKSLKTGDLLK